MAVLVRSARPVTQYLVGKKLEVHFLLPERSRETRPVRLVHHCDDPTSTANPLFSGDLLHFESLKRSRDVGLSDVVRGGFLEEIVEHTLRQPRWQIFGHVAMVVEVGTGLSTLCRNEPGMWEVSAERGGIQRVREGTRADCENFVEAHPIERELGRENLGVRVRLRALADGGNRIVHRHAAANSEFGNRTQCVGYG